MTALPLHFAITKAIHALVCVCAMPKSEIEIVRGRDLHARLGGATFSASVLSADSAGFRWAGVQERCISLFA